MRELFLPEQASAYASRLDLLYLFLCAIAVFFSALIFVLIISFALRYRRGSQRPRARPVHGSLWLEAAWIAVPLTLTMVLFAWGANLYFEAATPPNDALDLYVVGKQWMWKVQHPNGRREINELHLPVDQPVRITLTSEDVIHSFYVPAFRLKMDAVPGRYSRVWYHATRPGTFHLFCAEYCGTKHAQMTGRVIAMEPAAYQSWLAGSTGESMIAAGRRLFERLGCVPCHQDKATQRGPSLENLYSSKVLLKSGQTVVADEAYIRDSILKPNEHVVSGYDANMPTFQDQVGEEGILQIIAYIKSLSHEGGESD